MKDENIISPFFFSFFFKPIWRTTKAVRNLKCYSETFQSVCSVCYIASKLRPAFFPPSTTFYHHENSFLSQNPQQNE